MFYNSKLNMSLEISIYFFLIISLVAFLYSSVGHGGASGYIALMTLFSLPITYIKPIALVLNIFVAGVSFFFYQKKLFFKWELFFPFAISSIPASFIGGYISIDSYIYKIILGLFLLIAVLRILLIKIEENLSLKKNNKKLSFIIGFIIGFISGLIGIGGGIILSPIIVLLKWGTLKQTAAVSALFIFVNSISGFMGYLINGNILPSEYLILIPIVLFGGILGSLYGSFFSSNRILSYLLAFVLIIASSKLLFL